MSRSLTPQEKLALHEKLCGILVKVEALFKRPENTAITLIIRDKVNPDAHILETSEDDIEDAFNAARSLLKQFEPVFPPNVLIRDGSTKQEAL